MGSCVYSGPTESQWRENWEADEDLAYYVVVRLVTTDEELDTVSGPLYEGDAIQEANRLAAADDWTKGSAGAERVYYAIKEDWESAWSYQAENSRYPGVSDE